MKREENEILFELFKDFLRDVRYEALGCMGRVLDTLLYAVRKEANVQDIIEAFYLGPSDP